MKIGLYFGSFNPIHIGHLLIANQVANECLVDKVWFVVSPQNPHKETSSLLNEYDRLHLVKEAIADDDRFRAIDIEFKLPRPSYTIDTLAYLEEKYPTHKFSIILGGDSFANLPKWKNYEKLIINYSFIVYERLGENIPTNQPKNVIVLKAPLLQISSTQIRQLIKEGKCFKYYTPPTVWDEITKNGYYK